jgi:hypothetical protein
MSIIRIVGCAIGVTLVWVGAYAGNVEGATVIIAGFALLGVLLAPFVVRDQQR